jgi:8-oxo-dGTP diphosphatase
MVRISAKGIVIRHSTVLVLYRNKRGEEYYTFPGGAIEQGETNKEAVVRELAEETSITVTPGKLLYRVVYGDGSEQLYYLCDYVSGEPELRGDSEEKEETNRGENVYKPLWLPLKSIPNTILYPIEVKNALIEDLQAGFSGPPKEFFIIHHSLVNKSTYE